jgi:hypothetical protein
MSETAILLEKVNECMSKLYLYLVKTTSNETAFEENLYNILLEKLRVAHGVRFVKPASSLPCSHDITTGSYSKPL